MTLLASHPSYQRLLHHEQESAAWLQHGAHLHLRFDLDSFLGVFSHNAEAANTLAIQAHVLGIGLAAA